MDLQTLIYFKEIAQGKTYFDVSENYHLSQSSLSKMISKLEEELDVTLFDRSRRSVVPTEAGRCLLEAVNEIEPVMEHTKRRLAALKNVQEVRLGIVPNTDYMNLDQRIYASSFLREHPEISVDLYRETYSDESFELIRKNHVDILVTKLFQIVRDYCDYEIVGPDPMYVVMPKDHPLAMESSVDFKRIYEEPIITRSYVVRRAIQESCNRLGLDMVPNFTFNRGLNTGTNRLSTLNQVCVGQGITIYFKNDLRPMAMRNLVYVPVTNVPEFPVVLAKRKGRELNTAQKMCWEYLRQEIKNEEW